MQIDLNLKSLVKPLKSIMFGNNILVAMLSPNVFLLADIHPCIYNNSPEIWKPIVDLLCHNKLREEMHE